MTIGRTSIVKMTILPKIISRSNAILIKVSVAFFADLKQKILKFLWKPKRSPIVQAVWRRKNTAGVIILPDFRLYCKAPVIKVWWYWHKDRLMGQQNITENPEINPYPYGLHKSGKNIKMEKRWSLQYVMLRKLDNHMKLEHFLILYKK